MSANSVKMSTIFPLPSSPHWAPTTITAAMAASLAETGAPCVTGSSNCQQFQQGLPCGGAWIRHLTRFHAAARSSQARGPRASDRGESSSEGTMAFGFDGSLFDSAVRGDSEALTAVVAAVRPHVERQLLRYPVGDEDRRDLL